MHLSISAILTITGLVSAAAVDTSIAPRGNLLNLNTTGADLGGSYCIGLGEQFIIYTETWGSSDKGCGGGVLDNLRGQCCTNVVNWGCDRAGPSNNGARMSFALDCNYLDHCVEDAIWLASPPDRRETGVNCRPPKSL
ncbi:hypothetical protein SEUCBS140593_008268 [Sporothrix eucalyptigena]|uniref:Uncharacterized protein n=1 Tax=Sporothrix eucalyptigena TaxID=1812306 RepID=A0ABP0CKH5_9PEZI